MRTLADFCHSANVGRTHFNHRLAVIAAERARRCKSSLPLPPRAKSCPAARSAR